MASRKLLVLARHGESEWTKNNLFCGWYDANLSEKGLEEALECANALKNEGFRFDIAFTSLLTRAHQTLEIILKELGQSNITIEKTWRLNERHYGALTGFNKEEMAAKYGLTEVQTWRRSFDILPPPMTKDHKYYQDIVNNPKLNNFLNTNEFPVVESLKTTMDRVIPYWKEVIVPHIKEGKKSSHSDAWNNITRISETFG
uniref:phosphoglycerate mutase (2,3-diphosphoglycerate-dependent) n=1 Tax=Clastoptera arizonana TaxID=38151 RepID=A0A1B6DGE4_9HEMI